MKRNHSFTLVELLTVIGIIVVLAGLLMPAINGAMKRAHETACANNLRQLGIAEKNYSTDYQNFILAAGAATSGVNGNWADVLYDFVKNNEIFICPETDKEESYLDQIDGVANNGSANKQLSYIANSNVHVLPTGNRIKIYAVEYASSVISLGPNTDSGASNGNLTAASASDTEKVSVERHSGKRANYIMVDGHVQSMDKTEAQNSDRWSRLN